MPMCATQFFGIGLSAVSQPGSDAVNGELYCARALTVVHYLQNDAKVDPKRLAAVAFGQYRPASRAKAKNRRIEIVLYPKHQLAR